MALIKLKPTSPGARFVVRVSRKHLHKGGPHEPLTVHQNKTGARNHSGRITTRHIGGGSRQKYRIIDFRRDKDGVTGVVERLEYDPNRTAYIALIKYSDGERRYILAPKGVKDGEEIRSGSDAPIKSGNAMALRHVPVGSTVHNIELKPGRGGQLARSAGNSALATCSSWAARVSTNGSTACPSRRPPPGRVSASCSATTWPTGSRRRLVLTTRGSEARYWR